MHKVKSILCFRARNHPSDTEPSTITPGNRFDTTTDPLLSSTITQAADTDAPASSHHLSQVPPATDSLADEPTTVVSQTPLWDQTLSEFRKQCKNEYKELMLPGGKEEYERLGLSEGGTQFEDSILNKKLPEIFQEEAGLSSHAIIRRLKSWLPALGAAKGLAMTLARLDPHHLAPYIVAGSFFAVEILLQTIPADQKEATLDVVCDSVIILLKWRSYEETLSPIHQSISDETAKLAVQRLNGDLPDLYTTALKLQARIQADTRSRKRFLVKAPLGILEAWKADLAKLKLRDRDCVATKDIIKDCLERQDHHAKVLRWIKKEGAPDPHHKEIKKETGMDQDAYRQAGRWFTESEYFRDWMTPGTSQPTRKVVWLKGTMGTGKSTLVCQAISRFSEEEDRRPPGNLRVAYYYCTASASGATGTNPDKEIVLRSLCRKLAWQPTGSIAKCAYDFYEKFSKEHAESPDWEDLLNHLLSASATPVILVIDGLDELSKEAELLKFLADSVGSRSNVYLLCSSRPHVLVATYFLHAALAEIETISGKGEPDMSVFIETTIEERTSSPEAQESIFCRPRGTALSDDLRRALEEGADGMFRWVEVWLSILFPPDPRNQIFESNDARDLISQIANSESTYLESGFDKLMVAYDQLWEVNARMRHKILQPRLFHLVLCAFDSLTLNQLTDALRIDPEGKKPYRTDFQSKHVEWLCHNFLVTTSTAKLRWAHQSAKDFVTRHITEGKTPAFSEASNHIYMSRIALQVISQIHHPAWDVAGLDLCYWRQFQSSEYRTTGFILGLKYIRGKGNLILPRLDDLGVKRESLVRSAILDHLQSREHMEKLAPVFKAASFASYVAARFVHHLRVVFDTTASMSGLEKLMRTMIASPDSALPAVARLIQYFSFIRTVLKWKDMEDYSMSSQLDRRAPLARRQWTSDEIIRTMTKDYDGQALVAPLQLLTLINMPDKDFVQYAVTVSRSTLKTTDWNSYPAELMFLACRYDSYNVVALFLNHSFFSESVYPTNYKLLRARFEYDRLPMHVAARNGCFKVVEELIKAEERDARNSSEESHTSSGNRITSEDNIPKLLYMPDQNGDLPIHLASKWTKKRESGLVFDLMIRYDAKCATLFPATLFHQPGVPDSARKQTSMLLTENLDGYLPIHLATLARDASSVQAMLQREIDAFREYVSTQSPRSSSQTHQYRSHLLFARSRRHELPIDVALMPAVPYILTAKTVWTITRTMLEFEDKWKDLTVMENRSLKRLSELLNSNDVFSTIIYLWATSYFRPEWLDWLLDRYEVYSSVKVTNTLAKIRNEEQTASVYTPYTEVALLQRQNDHQQIRRLEQLPMEPGNNNEAATEEPGNNNEAATEEII